MQVAQDLAAERAVLAGLCQYGNLMWLEIGHILTPECFSSLNQQIFLCIRHVLGGDDSKVNQVDLPTLQSAANDVGVSAIFTKNGDLQHINSILNTPLKRDNVKAFAQKVRKLQIIRLLSRQLKLTDSKLGELTGTESISEIINLAEDGIFNFTESLGGDEQDTPEMVADKLDEMVEEVCNNPVQQLGYSTKFPIYDKAIGGGLCMGVQLIGARMKVGKTMLGMNMGFNVALQGIPTLYMDSEMGKKQFKFRTLAMMTEVEINKIATGQIAKDRKDMLSVERAIKDLKKVPFKWVSINGMAFEQQIATLRKWIIQDVGLLPDGRAKPCCVVYDYIKLSDSSDLNGNMQEFQLLGFMTNALHNQCVRYDIPILAFVQLNRDGIAGEETDSIAQSDRIAWAVSSFSIFKKKSDEEIAQDGPSNGNRKLVPLFSRNGGLLEDKEYINCHMKGYCGKISEGKTNFEIRQGKGNPDDGFIVEDSGSDAHF